MGAWTAPASPLLMAGTGNWEQSKLEHPSVKPLGARAASLYFQGLRENFSSSLSPSSVCATLGALHQL